MRCRARGLSEDEKRAVMGGAVWRRKKSMRECRRGSRNKPQDSTGYGYCALLVWARGFVAGELPRRSARAGGDSLAI